MSKQEKGKLKPLDHNFIDLEALMEHETIQFNIFYSSCLREKIGYYLFTVKFMFHRKLFV